MSRQTTIAPERFCSLRFKRYRDDLSRAIYDLSREKMGEVPPIVYWHKPPLDESPKMSAIARLKEKALQARQVAPDAIRQFEADLDAILAEKAGLDEKRAAAVSPHQEAIAGVKGELDGLKSAIDILSNGDPE